MKNLQIRNSTAEFLIFTKQNKEKTIEVIVDEDSVWLSQKLMAELFGTTRNNITMHLKDIYESKELDEKATSKDFLLVQQEGNRSISRMVNVYNLDAIISVGYRVNSARATQFRIWATKVLKEYLVRGYALNRERLKQLGQAA